MAYYRWRRRQPLDPKLAVFGVYWYRGYSCNPRAIYEAAQAKVPGLRGVWVVTPERVNEIPDGVDYVVAGTFDYYDVIARATVFVNNVNFPDELVKRPGTTHLMTHHGTPLKYMGLDLEQKPQSTGSRDFEALIRRCARWDFSLSSNRHSTRIWERVYPGTYESLEYGYPRNDVLVRSGKEDVERIRDQLGVASSERTVLYAPTYRDTDPGFVARLDVTRLAAQLGSGWVVLLRRHHSYDDDPAARDFEGETRILDVASHPSAEEVCLAADALVTDYSSIMFDYAVLDRPIVVFAPDWEDYQAVRGAYFDLKAEPPGIVADTTEQVAQALRTGEASGTAASSARAEFRARFCSLDDGAASDRVVARVWGAT